MAEKKELSVALGTFDGFHIGHRAVLENAVNHGEIPYVLLFDEHPQKVFFNKSPGELITEKTGTKLLSELKIRKRTISFNSIKDLTFEEFFYEILVKKMNSKVLSCGFNYRFGSKALGDVEKLKILCEKENIKLFVSEPVIYKGEPVSSTRIRNLIKNGNIEDANEMLGRYFSYDFKVVHGDKRGRTIDSPTINQFFVEDFIVPQYGVYASFTEIDGKKYPSVTNIGIRPSIEGNSPERSETNIVGYSGDLYGKNVSVYLIKKIRGEIKFETLEQLKNQIEKDRVKSVEISKEKGIIYE